MMNKRPSCWKGLACFSELYATPLSGLVDGIQDVGAKEQGRSGGDDAISECEGGLATALGGQAALHEEYFKGDGATMGDTGCWYHWSLLKHTTRTWLRPHINPRLLALTLRVDGQFLTQSTSGILSRCER
jgi:hypothetical protein